MSLIPPETIEQITAANDIVEVIGGYFPLKRSGPKHLKICRWGLTVNEGVRS